MSIFTFSLILRSPPFFRADDEESRFPSKLTSVQDLLTLSEDEIDIGMAALTLAQEIYPDMDVAAHSARIDALAERVRALAQGTPDPDRRVRCLNTVLLLYEKFQGSRDSSFARKSESYYLNRLLDTKQGNCFSMPVLYIAVAERLGWPVYLVHVPDHCFVRYVDPTFKEQNIETTSNGGYVPDAKYAQDFLVSESGRVRGTYLRALTHRESLGDLVEKNAVTWGQRGRLPKAIDYLNVATKLNPRLVSAWANLASAHKMMAKRASGPEAQKHLELAAKYAKKRDELGFVHPKDIPPFFAAKTAGRRT